MTQYTANPPTDANEEWREVPGFRGRYKVSSAGNVMSNRRRDLSRLPIWKPMLFHTNRDGYKVVELQDCGYRLHYLVHRLVLDVFIGHRPGMETNHKNGVRDDNRLVNLEWCTRSENNRHSYDVLQRTRPNNTGSNNPRAILTEADVVEIRRQFAEGATRKELAARYNTRFSAIAAAIAYRSWTHVP